MQPWWHGTRRPTVCSPALLEGVDCTTHSPWSPLPLPHKETRPRRHSRPVCVMSCRDVEVVQQSTETEGPPSRTRCGWGSRWNPVPLCNRLINITQKGGCNWQLALFMGHRACCCAYIALNFSSWNCSRRPSRSDGVAKPRHSKSSTLRSRNSHQSPIFVAEAVSSRPHHHPQSCHHHRAFHR
jgi:hypothetical protein